MDEQRSEAIQVGTVVKVAKGCRAMGIDKGTSATVVEVTAMGADWSHAARVVIKMRNGFGAGKSHVLWARHPNRLADTSVRLNKGTPGQYVELERAR